MFVICVNSRSVIKRFFREQVSAQKLKLCPSSANKVSEPSQQVLMKANAFKANIFSLSLGINTVTTCTGDLEASDDDIYKANMHCFMAIIA